MYSISYRIFLYFTDLHTAAALRLKETFNNTSSLMYSDFYCCPFKRNAVAGKRDVRKGVRRY